MVDKLFVNRGRTQKSLAIDELVNMKTQSPNKLLLRIALLLITSISMFAGRTYADTLVLVHGAFQSASDWGAVVSQLESTGNNVIAVNLPGRDTDGEAAKAISLQSYIDNVIGVVSTVDQPVHLIGHSFGGITITAVAEVIPDNIETLVYIAAYVPEDGESMEKLAYSDKDNGFTEKSFVVAKDYSHATILEEDQARLFGNDADAEQINSLQASMIKEPLAPIGTPVSITEGNSSSVKKAYIRTLRDQTVSTPLQTKMLMRAKIDNVIDIDSGHLPYLTEPEQLVGAILKLTNTL